MKIFLEGKLSLYNNLSDIKPNQLDTLIPQNYKPYQKIRMYRDSQDELEEIGFESYGSRQPPESNDNNKVKLGILIFIIIACILYFNSAPKTANQSQYGESQSLEKPKQESVSTQTLPKQKMKANDEYVEEIRKMKKSMEKFELMHQETGQKIGQISDKLDKMNVPSSSSSPDNSQLKQYIDDQIKNLRQQKNSGFSQRQEPQRSINSPIKKLKELQNQNEGIKNQLKEIIQEIQSDRTSRQHGMAQYLTKRQIDDFRKSINQGNDQLKESIKTIIIELKNDMKVKEEQYQRQYQELKDQIKQLKEQRKQYNQEDSGENTNLKQESYKQDGLRNDANDINFEENQGENDQQQGQLRSQQEGEENQQQKQNQYGQKQFQSQKYDDAQTKQQQPQQQHLEQQQKQKQVDQQNQDQNYQQQKRIDRQWQQRQWVPKQQWEQQQPQKEPQYEPEYQQQQQWQQQRKRIDRQWQQRQRAPKQQWEQQQPQKEPQYEPEYQQQQQWQQRRKQKQQQEQQQQQQQQQQQPQQQQQQQYQEEALEQEEERQQQGQQQKGQQQQQEIKDEQWNENNGLATDSKNINNYRQIISQSTPKSEINNLQSNFNLQNAQKPQFAQSQSITQGQPDSIISGNNRWTNTDIQQQSQRDGNQPQFNTQPRDYSVLPIEQQPIIPSKQNYQGQDINQQISVKQGESRKYNPIDMDTNPNQYQEQIKNYQKQLQTQTNKPTQSRLYEQQPPVTQNLNLQRNSQRPFSENVGIKGNRGQQDNQIAGKRAEKSPFYTQQAQGRYSRRKPYDKTPIQGSSLFRNDKERGVN